ncbi:MAG: ferrous iron transport protein B, partial [Clostridia bacterium]|nr:ferrous iron transport protein B [Clostridia bacterium]
MGLTNRSVGKNVTDNGCFFEKRHKDDVVVALAGNPNVGKSTVFNALTGMRQHTGNWPGKTVSSAHGYLETDKGNFVLVDIPGTYSLLAHSAEESVARDFICFGNPDITVVVCDATCLERNLNLVLQITEVTDNIVVCVNLMDEAVKKHIHINLQALSKHLHLPVVGITAHKKDQLPKLVSAIEKATLVSPKPLTVSYPAAVETAVKTIENALKDLEPNKKRCRFIALKLLENDPALQEEITSHYGKDNIQRAADQAKSARDILAKNGISQQQLKDLLVSTLMDTATAVCRQCVRYNNDLSNNRDVRIDRFLTGKKTAYISMILLLLVIFWLTIVGANYPSALLSAGFSHLETYLTRFFALLQAPDWLYGALVLGVYRVLTNVIAVMLPPMAIFFPLFTLLEDVGYLPRLAYNLDKPFQKSNACGKQALTMCMGFGCNAAGVIGARIIDSPRERLLAILTNTFVPCNGRFPTLISILTMFFIGNASGFFSFGLSALLLTILILLGVFVTFAVTKLLSVTVLKGMPSSFTLELPPYRKPQIGKVIWRSIGDRTIFVLGRAAAVAAPAGLLLWLTANISVGNTTVLQHAANFLDPFARALGLDGVILIAFILGFPANEIVVPIIIMAYMSTGTLTDITELATLKTLFINNGWTPLTALNVMLFSLFHWPCSTTLATIHKETASLKW